MTLLLVMRCVRMVLAWVDGEGDPAATARVLIDVAVATGVPAEMLSGFLTAAAAKRVEQIADIAQMARVGAEDSQ